MNVSDISGNRQDKIANAARVLGRSKDRRKVFIAIYTNKKKIKTVNDIRHLSRLRSNVRILQEAKKLASEDIVQQIKINGKTAYKKLDFYQKNRDIVLRVSSLGTEIDGYPTKVTPKINMGTVKLGVSFPKNLQKRLSKTISRRFKRRKPIDNNTRNLVWLKYMGLNAKGKCFCCKTRIIDFTHFEVGHNRAAARKGSNHISNLRPICAPCNRSMSTMSIETYRKQFN